MRLSKRSKYPEEDDDRKNGIQSSYVQSAHETHHYLQFEILNQAEIIKIDRYGRGESPYLETIIATKEAQKWFQSRLNT